MQKLTKSIIELHGRNIGVQRSVGEGSTFYVWLPTDQTPFSETSKKH